ncbi:MAG: hypothetical protein IPO92_13150 [Saprospiraceae bacterium]|nr:hypothetical protein [Saprospiraceae bacterium]
MTPAIIEKPKTIISADTLKSLENYTSTEGQVIVHGYCKTGVSDMYIRIWPTTYLYDQHSDHRCDLLYFEKISGFPSWTLVPAHTEFVFTLIFSPLPKSCILFDLKEVIPQSNGFSVPNILRNLSDVYYLDFSTE